MNKKFYLLLTCLCVSVSAIACGMTNNTGTAQTRTDLTSDHIRGLYSGMNRSDIEDLIGMHDEALSNKEDITAYSLADGTTAILRYSNDQLAGVYIRDKNNNETPLFTGGSLTDTNTNNQNNQNNNETTDGDTNNNNNGSLTDGNAATGYGTTDGTDNGVTDGNTVTDNTNTDYDNNMNGTDLTNTTQTSDSESSMVE